MPCRIVLIVEVLGKWVLAPFLLLWRAFGTFETLLSLENPTWSELLPHHPALCSTWSIGLEVSQHISTFPAHLGMSRYLALLTSLASERHRQSWSAGQCSGQWSEQRFLAVFSCLSRDHRLLTLLPRLLIRLIIYVIQILLVRILRFQGLELHWRSWGRLPLSGCFTRDLWSIKSLTFLILRSFVLTLLLKSLFSCKTLLSLRPKVIPEKMTGVNQSVQRHGPPLPTQEPQAAKLSRRLSATVETTFGNITTF